MLVSIHIDRDSKYDYNAMAFLHLELANKFNNLQILA